MENMSDNDLDNGNFIASENIHLETKNSRGNGPDDKEFSDSDNKNLKPKKKRSLVWSFFKKISHDRVQCLLCKHEQNYQGTSGNILRHLKARHAIDATIKGQQDPQNQVMIKELLSMTPSINTLSDSEQKPTIKRKPSLDSVSTDTADLYSDNNNKQQFQSFANGDIFCQELQEDTIYNIDRKEQKQKSAKREKLEENRILAETAYFREKAAYFRIQKHYTALQAKKVKLEIDQIVSNNERKN